MLQAFLTSVRPETYWPGKLRNRQVGEVHGADLRVTVKVVAKVVYLVKTANGWVVVAESMPYEDGAGALGRAAAEGERWVAENPERHRYQLLAA